MIVEIKVKWQQSLIVNTFRLRTSFQLTSHKLAWWSTPSLTGTASCRRRRYWSTSPCRPARTGGPESWWATRWTLKDRDKSLLKVRIIKKICLQLGISEGKDLASLFDCKFIETSVGLNHNVDELLVGVLKQILLRQEDDPLVEQRLEIKVSSICIHACPRQSNREKLISEISMC